MSDFQISEFVRDRDTAFTKAVMEDDWDAVVDYLEKYDLPGVDRARERDIVIMVAIYKGVRECTNIPDSVKAVAAEKCIALGFSPSMF